MKQFNPGKVAMWEATLLILGMLPVGCRALTGEAFLAMRLGSRAMYMRESEKLKVLRDQWVYPSSYWLSRIEVKVGKLYDRGMAQAIENENRRDPIYRKRLWEEDECLISRADEFRLILNVFLRGGLQRTQDQRMLPSQALAALSKGS
jgi:hypothetical protein